MNRANKKKQAGLSYVPAIIIVVVIVALAGGVYYWQKKGGKLPSIKVKVPGITSPTPVTTPGAGAVGTVPPNIVIPDKEGANVPKNVAIPQAVGPAAPGVTAEYRSFNIKAENDAYTPSEVRAYQGDTVHINFTAVGKTYDITILNYGLSQTVTAGVTKILEFQATTVGQFVFFCQSCSNPDKVKGTLIVAPRPK